MSSSELLFTPATVVASLIRRKKLSPVEHIDAVLGAIDKLQPELNCFMTVTADDARKAAKAAEQAVMSGEELGPLHGVAVSIKDLFPTKGVRTTYGTVAFENNIAERDDILVTRLREAGAIMVGKTTTPEFGIKGTTEGPIFGVTRNPWDTSRTPGGSSGGAAASVAAGLTPLALGSDGAGSTRGPAACCGLVGLKGTTGVLPWQEGRETFGNPVAAGPLARTVADATAMMSVMAGADPMDPWSESAIPFGLVSAHLLSKDLSGVRIGYLARTGATVVAAQVAENTRTMLGALADLGADVEEVTTPVDWMSDDQRVLYLCSIANYLGHIVDKYGERTDKVLRGFVEAGKKYDIAAYLRAVASKTRLFRAVQGLFETYDFLVSPTLTRTALAADFDGMTGRVEIDGKEVGSAQPHWTGFMYPFNLTGHPALSIPSGFGGDGLPTGFQIIGPRHADSDVLRIGALLEEVCPWADRRPPVSAS
jgi:aspartyl-tRNA(Asn)/glutamyl-tRNA(Gln) amidotransferase subunit A